MDRAPETQTLLQPRPPLHSGEEALLRIVASLPRLTRTCRDQLLAVLRRVGESVPAPPHRARAALAHTAPTAAASTAGGVPRTKGSPIRACRPNHVWMADFSVMARLFRLPGLPHLAVIMDVYSRAVLFFRLFASQPTSEQAADMLREAARRYGAPRHFISDHGSQFTGEPFQSALADLRIRSRLGAIGESGSIAIVERLWRTVKEILDLHQRPEVVVDLLARRVHRAVLWYNHLRPHMSLSGATPVEKYFDLRPQHLDAVPAPRGQPSEQGASIDIELRFLDGDHRCLPYFLKRSA